MFVRDLSSGVLVYSKPGLTGTWHTLPSGVLGSGKPYRWDMTSFVGSAESAPSADLYFQTL